MSLSEAEVGMGNDFELNDEMIPVLWKTQLDPELMRSYIERGCPPGTSQQNKNRPNRTSVKETGTSHLCQFSSSIGGDTIDCRSKSTLPQSDIPVCTQYDHSSTHGDTSVLGPWLDGGNGPESSNTIVLERGGQGGMSC